MEEWEVDRAKREEKMMQLWKTFTNREGFRQVYKICGRSIRVLKDALLSYENGAFLGSAIMCRASTEALVYATASLDKTRIKKDPTQNVYANGITYDYAECRYGFILEKAKETGFVKSSDEEDINEIRKEGNFAAHFGQKFDERIINYDPTDKSFALDISEERAMEILELTEKFNSMVMSRIFEFVKTLPIN